MEHVFANVCQEVEYNADSNAFNEKLTGPQFIGQGCCKHVGSDSYGYYIVEKKQIGKNKTIWGLNSAKCHITSTWEDGSMTCTGPISWKAEIWIMSWGKNKNGSPKWWYCNSDGKRFNGCRCLMSFSGAHAYRNPSF